MRFKNEDRIDEIHGKYISYLEKNPDIETEGASIRETVNRCGLDPFTKYLQVTEIQPLEDYKLWCRLMTGETKIYDFTPHLESEMFRHLKDKAKFDTVIVNGRGVPTWFDENRGIYDLELDISFILIDGEDVGETSKSLKKDGNKALTKVLTPRQYESAKEILAGSLIGITTAYSDTIKSVTIKAIGDDAFDIMIIRGYGGNYIANVLQTGIVSSGPEYRPDTNMYEKEDFIIVVEIQSRTIVSVISRNVDMAFFYLKGLLHPDLAVFLKENFGVDDVDALSDEDYDELYEKLCEIEVNEVCKADNGNSPLSEYGNNATDVVTYMGNQFIEGGRRWRPK